jgi:DNA-binding response OmpR family regulator
MIFPNPVLRRYMSTPMYIEAMKTFATMFPLTAALRKTKRILFVDDEPDICFVLEQVLSENGFLVDTYEDPLLALEKFKAYSYDLVILDIKMPGLNGFALCREIKKLDRKVKICFLTAGEMEYGYSDISSKLPANCFIRKPIDNEELLRRIDEIIVGDEFEAGKVCQAYIHRTKPSARQYLTLSDYQ